ncbi:hypothetical protein B0H63DRAFT_456764 [Podospora didyma]|uniref:Heterokaryon incompatibility domain-containing protein n=1 Tax=Podospora didyma TaxID=330526 RepID=A0AAE0P453_9PEZI|nr:hypothetical protein B0H63DRAFT_456764 [Podospora didyma]
MRLLNVTTLEVDEFYGANIPPYAIFSHTWGHDEVTLPEMAAISRYRRSQQQQQEHEVSQMRQQPTDKADTIRMMLLSSMLLAFRGNNHSPMNRYSASTAITNGYRREEDERALAPSLLPHQFQLKAGYGKISYACDQAVKDGHRYIWVDTCCIDRSSSADVTEAINSMFSWYQQAAVCYVYMQDVVKGQKEGYRTWKDNFAESRWFTRGWTLQELLAPQNVVFYGRGWKHLGSKSTLAKTIEKATKIDELTLREPKLVHKASIARRMSWAANRQTSRVEDMAYSLMGIFGVNMAPLYGEGENAFLRLQEEIIKRSDDQTILAWGTLGQTDSTPTPHYAQHLDHEFDHEEMAGTTGILAKSPRDFAGMDRVVPSSASPETVDGIRDVTNLMATSFAMTNKGLNIKLGLLQVGYGHATHQRVYLGVLQCHREEDPSGRLGILLTETETPNVLLRTRTKKRTWVSSKDVAAARSRTVYIPNSATTLLRADQSEEIVWVKAHDLTAPGYEIIDIRARTSQWNREFSTMRLAGIADRGVFYQLAVIAFFNKHLDAGFLLRILIDSTTDACFVDLVQPATSENGKPSSGAGSDAERGAALKAQARQIWNSPGKISASPSSTDSSIAKEIPVTNPDLYGTEEAAAAAAEEADQLSWTAKATAVNVLSKFSRVNVKSLNDSHRGVTRGLALKLNPRVTFVEQWEKEYHRTVEATVARKKRGVMVLDIASMLWDAGGVQKAEEVQEDSE